MKKLLSILIAVLMVATFAVGCGTTDNGDNGDNGATYADGVYFAQEDEFASSGYKYFVVITVEGGEITDAHWGGTNLKPVGNKKTFSAEGNYPMVERGGAAAEWDVQAAAAEAWLIENQDPAAFDDLYTSEEGYTDALETDDGTQVSIHVIEFFELAKTALAGTPVSAGDYETPEDYVVNAVIESDGDWNNVAEFIVVNGTIVSANYNATSNVEDQPLSKKELGADYGMVERGGASAEWDEQAESVEAFVLETQGFDIEFDADGKTDAIAGVTITANYFQELFEMALGQ
ncbi:hypothetical protein [Alkalibacter saccharofermentans]|uniref:Major membrane immunogen, membrane-anchored lipoprotein n=1 Tax=Alkalibacter saccharofermentans DSM 14828 TaxID=1120975 RepID=A0A1M4YXD7_9FIRM|nr:hypothetical protein [Alkalibacter saccharofermentans]SHF10453.1 Major membrane immunogen, membrane-anchored lipoprotein [Alkalibacter saccharofermentans DSM 14828]